MTKALGVPATIQHVAEENLKQRVCDQLESIQSVAERLRLLHQAEVRTNEHLPYQHLVNLMTPDEQRKLRQKEMDDGKGLIKKGFPRLVATTERRNNWNAALDDAATFHPDHFETAVQLKKQGQPRPIHTPVAVQDHLRASVNTLAALQYAIVQKDQHSLPDADLRPPSLLSDTIAALKFLSMTESLRF